MMKAGILEQIGQRSLLLPELINQGLAAHDRLKYYLTLLQTAYRHAGAHGAQVPDLRNEREAAGVFDQSLDYVVGNSRMVSPAVVHIPGAAAILERIFADARQMLSPLETSAAMHGELTERAAIYTRRLNEQIARAPSATDDQITSHVLETFTRLTSNGHDTINQIVMDLHWELNRLQASINVETLDGAHVYGLRDADRQLVRAFMQGIHETAPLKFDHPGLETTATRDGDHLVEHVGLDGADPESAEAFVDGAGGLPGLAGLDEAGEDAAFHAALAGPELHGELGVVAVVGLARAGGLRVFAGGHGLAEELVDEALGVGADDVPGRMFRTGRPEHQVAGPRAVAAESGDRFGLPAAGDERGDVGPGRAAGQGAQGPR